MAQTCACSCVRAYVWSRNSIRRALFRYRSSKLRETFSPSPPLPYSAVALAVSNTAAQTAKLSTARGCWRDAAAFVRRVALGPLSPLSSCAPRRIPPCPIVCVGCFLFCFFPPLPKLLRRRYRCANALQGARTLLPDQQVPSFPASSLSFTARGSLGSRRGRARCSLCCSRSCL